MTADMSKHRTGDQSGLEDKPDIESSESLRFYPPVYIQRYIAIKNILDESKWQNNISKVADFGCAEFKFFKYIKSLKHIEHIFGVDVEEYLMPRCRYEAIPLIHEYLSHFARKLTVDLFVGSIAEYDARLKGVDAVICIELIEHLYPETLDKVPLTIFKYLRPKLAIFTTPNAEFNVLFNLKGFRHEDHKFEWTRKEFESWCYSILASYDDYDVYFEGIGEGPKGTEHLGCVSQMAIFSRKNMADGFQTEITEQHYKLWERIEYPYEEDTRSEEEKLMLEIKCKINDIFINKHVYSHYERDDSKFEVPVNFLWKHVQSWCPTEDFLAKFLMENGYHVVNTHGSKVLVVEESDSHEESNDSDDMDNLDYTHIATQYEEVWD